MSLIILPSSVDEKSVRVPMEFPLRAQDDSVVDANDRCVLTIDNSVEIAESLKFTKLFAKAPDMWQLLGDCYIVLSAVARSSGVDHGSPEEKDKEDCLLCRCEALLEALR